MTRLIRTAYSSILISVLFGAFAMNAMAADEWLADGTAIATELTVQTSVEMLMETDAVFFGHVDALCSWLYDGTVGPGGHDSVTDFLTLSGELLEVEYGPELELLHLPMVVECEIDEGSLCQGALFWIAPLNLPWETEIELMEGSIFLDKVLNAGGNPGFLIVCQNVLTGLWEEEECKGNTSYTLKNLAGGGVEGDLAETFGSETGKCIVIKTTAETTWLESGVTLTVLTAGESLSVS